jgi:probable HAF family extracellular repeat protein
MRTDRPAALVATVVLAALAVPGAASAAEPTPLADSDKPSDVAIAFMPDRGRSETIGRAGTPSAAVDPEGHHPGKDAADAAGGFVYRNGSYTPLGVVPGAAPLPDLPGFPGATVAQTHFAINDRGEAAGIYADEVGPDGQVAPGSLHGFVKFRRGEIATFDVPGAASVLVKGNNNQGQVVGLYVDSGVVPGPDGLLPPDTVHGFIRDGDGRITTFDLPFPYLHNISDINDRGQVVGYYDDPSRPFNLAGGFLREPDGEIVKLDVPGTLSTAPHCINNKGHVVGSYVDAGAEPNPDGTIPQGVIHGFVWKEGRYTTFDVDGSVYTAPFGCNDRGQITGGYQDAQGNEHGFLLTNGRTTTLDAPGRIDNIAWGINNRGEVIIPEPAVRLSYQVATTAPDPSGDTSFGFVLDRDRFARIDLPGAEVSGATGISALTGISNRGRIVGKAVDTDGEGFYGLVGDSDGRFRRIDYPGALATYANKIDDRGRIVGEANTTAPTVVYTPGTFGYLLEKGSFTRIAFPGAVSTRPLGINNRGQVVGEYLDQAGVLHGFRWEKGRFTTFDGPLGTGAGISDINDRGDMVGAYGLDPADPSAGIRGFLLRNGKYTTFSALDSVGTFPFDLNNRGQIAGTTISDPDLAEVRGFLADGADGPVTRIEFPGAPGTAVTGLNDRGRIVGFVDLRPNAAPTAARSTAVAVPHLEGLPLGRGDRMATP